MIQLHSFRTRILLGYGAGILVLAVVFGWAVANLLTLGRASDLILRENYASILAAENMLATLERQDSQLLYVLLGIESTPPAGFRDLSGDFHQWLARAKDNVTVAGESGIVAAIEAGYQSFLGTADRLLREPSGPGAAASYKDDVRPLFHQVRADCIRLREVNQKTMVEASASAQEQAVRATWRMLVAGVAMILGGLVASIMLSRRLAQPVERMRAAAERLGEGDYEVEVPAEGSDELSQLGAQFNAMAGRLKEFHDLNIGQILAEKHKTEAILQSVDDGLLVVDPELRVTGVNPMAASVFGLAPDSALDRPVEEVLGQRRIADLLRLAAQTGKPPRLAEDEDILSVPRGEGQAHYKFSVIPVRAGAAVISVVLLLRDVTRLRELDRLKTEFVMTASHELRTPLTSIGLSIDLLLDKAADKLSERERELLAIAHEDVARLKALVTELLDLSKIEAGRLEMDFARVPVDLICEKAATAMGAQAGESGRELSFACGGDLPAVRADANKITWVLVNLIGNALRHTPKGGHVRVAAGRAGGFVHLSVADDGEGIPLEYQAKIFDKFVQVKSDKTSGGSGLGLAICKEIVRAHGGTIWVESAPGRGATFTFTLPVAEYAPQG